MKILIIILLFPIYLYAQEAMPVSSAGPVKVHANNMQYFGSESRAEFKGSVVASNDNFTLTSDRVNVFFNNKNEVLRIVCKGNVNFKTAEILAVSTDAELNQVTKIITMKGGAKVWQRENYLEGETVNLQYETKEVLVDKGSSERVTVIFTPSDNGSVAQ
ncbi:MAG: hypothetical protein LBV09_02445 [Deferribacteraceae bacterium]|jgi:lipopolysaccharide transport protein LptA|nr:hypothetical protein [Deferribacteraceae bacterium]